MSKFWSPWKRSAGLLTLSQEKALFPQEGAYSSKPTLAFATLVISGIRSGVTPTSIARTTLASEVDVENAYAWLRDSVNSLSVKDETLQAVAAELDTLYDSGNKHAGDLLLASSGPTFNKNFTPLRVGLISSSFLMDLYPSTSRVRHY